MFVLKQKDSNWWIADWEGDPGRTLKLENAKVYTSKKDAEKDIKYNVERYSHIRKIDLVIEELNIQ